MTTKAEIDELKQERHKCKDVDNIMDMGNAQHLVQHAINVLAETTGL